MLVLELCYYYSFDGTIDNLNISHIFLPALKTWCHNNGFLQFRISTEADFFLARIAD